MNSFASKLTLRVAVVAVAMVCLGGLSASAAPIVYGDLSGTNYDFNTITESSISDDGTALWGTPSVNDDTLVFAPTQYAAAANPGNGGFEWAFGLLNVEIMSTGVQTIDRIILSEGGDYTFSGIGGAGTSVSVGIGGTITILEDINGSVSGPGNVFTFDDLDVVFTPSNTASITGGTGTFGWTAEMDLDIAALFPDVTKLQLALDNNLTAFSEATSLASIQKKAVSGPQITIVPEPGTLMLVAPGLIALAIRSRRQSA